MDEKRVVEPDALERILNGQEKPRSIDLQLLRRITGNFSENRIIGAGGCGKVYKGILPNGDVVAVKKLLKCHTVNERMFLHEAGTMKKVEHQNIVRFLGYCSESQDKIFEVNGKTIKAEELERLLCFEYLRNGSLDKYIDDELRGLDWQDRYQIIKGICDGLLHLHQKSHILHMDLKPANILLDDQMLPKITDFGLARTLDAISQTTSADHMFSPGYCAPEYIRNKSNRSPKVDIYSLGVIIIQLVTGSTKMPNTTKVLRRWRHRWDKSSEHTPLWYHQMKKCLELAVRCLEENPIKRPFVWEIIRELSEIDSWDDDQIKAATESSLDKIISGLDDMLGIEPLEWKWSLSQDEKPLPCSIELTNNTNAYMAFSIASNSLFQFLIEPAKGIAAPGTTCTATITLPAEAVSLLRNDCSEEIIVQSTTVDEGGNSQGKNNDEVDRIVDEVTVVLNMQLLRDEHYQETAKESGEPSSSAEMESQELVQGTRIVTELHSVNSFTGPLPLPRTKPKSVGAAILAAVVKDMTMTTNTERGYMFQEIVAHSSDVNCLKIGRKSSQVLVTGGEDHKVNLWAIGKPNSILSLSGHTSAVESVGFDSKEVFVAAGAANGTIKLWDLQETKIVCTLTVTGHRSNCMSVDFHPFGEFFASGSLDTNLKIWDLRRKGCIYTYKGHTGGVNAIRFTPDGRWLVSGGEDNTVKLWDLTAGKLLHEFKCHEGQIQCIDFHPHELLLATGSADRTVKFWDLETFKLIGSTRPEATGVRSITFNPDGRSLLCGLGGKLKTFSWEPIRCHDTVDVGWSKLADLNVHDGKLLGCSVNKSCVGIWVVDLMRLEPYAAGT